MCVYNISEYEILKEDLIVYKAVADSNLKDTEFKSLYSPCIRYSQVYFSEKTESDYVFYYPERFGESLIYKIGEKTTSSFVNTPGLYCFEKLDGALNAEIDFNNSVTFLLEVKIPKGTKIKKACTIYNYKDPNFLDVVLTEELIPVRVVSRNEFLPKRVE